MRVPPGDILLGLSISELVLVLHWNIISIVQKFSPDQLIKSNGDYCQISSRIGLAGSVMEFTF